MSVYTLINTAQLQPFISRYDLGELIGFSGIENGIENTNYRVHTRQGHFILTLFEELVDHQIQNIFSLLRQLRRQGLAVPFPQQDKHGHDLNKLQGKSAAIFNRLPGQSIISPSNEHCLQIGRQLAELHLGGRQSGFRRTNPRNLQGCRKLFDACKHHLTHLEIKRISAELAFQQSFESADIPFGVIHADLFRDNVLWAKNRISGVLDFYSSCNDFLLFDIAVTINDWCRNNTFICKHKADSLLVGYQSARKLEPLELKLLPVFLRRAALRFWLSRLNHILHAKNATLTPPKDPAEFRCILEQHCGITMPLTHMAC